MGLLPASLVLAMTSAALQAQTNPAPERVQFEAASVKPNTSGSESEQIRLLPGGRLEIRNMTLRMLLRTAYNVTSFQISSGPGWLDSDRFDIIAKPETDTGPAGLLLMLRSLLEQRFALAAHREVREQRAYLLSRSRGGLKLEAAEGTCVPREPGHAPPATPPGQPPPNYCGSMHRGRELLEGIGVPLADPEGFTLSTLAGQLSSILGRAVIDKTGLTGIFNFQIRWTPEDDSAQSGSPAATSDTAAPSLFTAIQEQLGLRLESGRGPVELLIIDRVEKPSAN
jgi:uncharacterized protein (TIGR03435 family)